MHRRDPAPLPPQPPWPRAWLPPRPHLLMRPWSSCQPGRESAPRVVVEAMPGERAPSPQGLTRRVEPEALPLALRPEFQWEAWQPPVHPHPRAPWSP
jgi:hypothetical protein